MHAVPLWWGLAGEGGGGVSACSSEHVTLVDLVTTVQVWKDSECLVKQIVKGRSKLSGSPVVVKAYACLTAVNEGVASHNAANSC